jgi:multimeric flavodoxin WrbA
MFRDITVGQSLNRRYANKIGAPVITILNLSRRANGINDAVCDLLCAGLLEKNIVAQQVRSRDLTIQFCTNCRTCMKPPGDALGPCHLVDDMATLLTSLMHSQTIILSAPINCYDLPSILRVIIERLGVYCYWPDESYSPKVRLAQKNINGILITTSAMPGLMVPITTRARKTFRLFAKPIGIKRIKYFHLGFKGRKVDMTLTERDLSIVQKIIRSVAATV